MLWLLLCLLPPLGCSRIVAQNSTFNEGNGHEEVAVTTRPHIYYCRSPNMETFSCWWHPLDNLTDGEEVTYVLTYSKDKGPKHECPDYTTAGPNSCHFDSGHTSIWKVYCINVTAVTARRNYTSQEHCLDVAEIVQTEAPVNLTYTLTDAGGDEIGHDALLSWTYPVPSDLQYGWITLVYELQYRRVTEPDNWKVKHPLREPHVELLGLPAGDYVVRVRCRSRNHGLWSKWSAKLLMSFPARPPTGKLLVLILVTGIGVAALLVIAFSVIPQSKKIKDYFLPPIPKPRIIGIDPMLLKKGNLDEINRHFSNFHSYRPPSYSEEVWDQVSADNVYLTTPKACSVPADPTDREKDALMVPCDLTPLAAHHQFMTQNPMSYMQSLSPYCSAPPDAFMAPLDRPSLWPRPEIVSLPGTDYSMMEHPGLPSTIPTPNPAAVTANRSPQDFYTCVQLMNDSGEVHLVPCLPPAYCREFPPLPKVDLDAEEKEEKKKKLADYQARKNAMNGSKDNGEAERSEAVVPLLPVAVDNKG
ncbi:growth hormone receptor-like [Thunnus maccoyii]|uniref:growth hormone receptor-like n=1 Tax=Thunnus maccoyii TaxID=8240 RepID=UPI001C4BA5AF|nr:growth hormone receptor-like [Thunnus maccoyii]XP_042260413.1 growth hormone receptor-like [Thunnus maccoyii]XP_042260414.1 growth hormone receptor-like [Thunnus maccoyii]